MHVERTRRLRAGERLTDVIAALAAALGIGPRILPATDEECRTIVETDAGDLDFDVCTSSDSGRSRRSSGIRFEGVDSAGPTSEVMAALADADLVVIGPSDLIVSIAPILKLPGVRDEVARADAVAVSPIIGGRALKGPADRMLTSLGHESTALGVARLYAGLVSSVRARRGRRGARAAGRGAWDEGRGRADRHALGRGPISTRQSTVAGVRLIGSPARMRPVAAVRILIACQPRPGSSFRIVAWEAAKTRLAPEPLTRGANDACQPAASARPEGRAHGQRRRRRHLAVSRQLAELVEPSGARLVVQRGMGLNEGLEQARFDALVDEVETLIVLHGDLPNLQASDIETLESAIPDDDSPAVAIAPDRAGTGTNGLVLRGSPASSASGSGREASPHTWRRSRPPAFPSSRSTARGSPST